MKFKDLRLAAGYASDAALAAAWGRSPRQVRRWSSGETPVPRWAWRLARAEAGIVPGWPRGWRACRDGVHIPGLGVATCTEIEARGWVWQLVHDQRQGEAERVYRAATE